MLISHNLRTREPAAIDDGGMVEPVRKDHIFLSNQGRDRPQVGGKTGLEGNHVLRALELCEPLLQLDMQICGAGNRADRSRSYAIFFRRLLCCFDDPGMVGQAEIVVRAEVEHVLSIHHQPGALRRANRADAVV